MKTAILLYIHDNVFGLPTEIWGIPMTKLDEHPTVVRHRQSPAKVPPKRWTPKGSGACAWTRGPTTWGLSRSGGPSSTTSGKTSCVVYPWTKGLVSIVCKMNREPIRSTARSVANLEFHDTGERTNEVASSIVGALEAEGHRAVNPSMGFPMEMDRSPGKIWVVAHKPVAVAAGLGQMGIHRNVIHPKFGNFILLATILVDAEVSDEGSLLDYNPCLECKLCVAACPVGAIGADGHFDFSACYTHNYREFLGGFGDWVENVVDSRDALDYRSRVSDSETASDVAKPRLRPELQGGILHGGLPGGRGRDRPIPGRPQGRSSRLSLIRCRTKRRRSTWSPARMPRPMRSKRFPHKRIKPVGNGLRPSSIRGFLANMPHVFQRHQSAGIGGNIPLHFYRARAGPRDRRHP